MIIWVDGFWIIGRDRGLRDVKIGKVIDGALDFRRLFIDQGRQSTLFSCRHMKDTAVFTARFVVG
jgi:hypothetical protein